MFKWIFAYIVISFLSCLLFYPFLKISSDEDDYLVKRMIEASKKDED